MITTTLAVLALASGLDLGVSPFTTPSWQTDYSKAMARASMERKPMAVFIGHGADTFKRMVADGAISSDSAKLLRESYVCLYLDADTATGKDLAGRFQMPEGLVISGPGGSSQAYRHAGTVTGADLTRRLSLYATAGPPTTTVVGGVVTARPAIVYGGCPGGSCGTVIPASGYTVAPASGYTVAPASGYYVYPGTTGYSFGGGCPNGRCPNSR